MGRDQSFHDHFSDASDAYAQARPTYPCALFDFLTTLAPRDGTVWDCATGNGQAAVELAERFQHVIATDASENQIQHAQQRDNIDYRVAPAEASGIADASIDLVTVAQALHWFDFERFFAEVHRVVRPGGVVCAWCYGLHQIEPAVDAVIGQLYHEIVGDYWTPERRFIDSMYEAIPFPFERVATPSFAMELDWTVDQVLAYLRTWSATKRYIEANGRDPVALVEGELREAWGTGEARLVRWPLGVLVGRV